MHIYSYIASSIRVTPNRNYPPEYFRRVAIARHKVTHHTSASPPFLSPPEPHEDEAQDPSAPPENLVDDEEEDEEAAPQIQRAWRKGGVDIALLRADGSTKPLGRITAWGNNLSCACKLHTRCSRAKSSKTHKEQYFIEWLLMGLECTPDNTAEHRRCALSEWDGLTDRIGCGV